MTIYAGDLAANGAISDLIGMAERIRNNLTKAKRYGYDIDADILQRIISGEPASIASVKDALETA